MGELNKPVYMSKTVGLAVAIPFLIWVVGQFGVEMPPEVAASAVGIVMIIMRLISEGGISIS